MILVFIRGRGLGGGLSALSAQSIAVTVGTLVDPDTGTEKAKQTILILIDGRTIFAVGSDVQVPSDANRLTCLTKLSCPV